ncbi:MAG: DUF6062 family protein [Firmicutes bacterium]|nr:DUF6062 family protein [Bacillota bacterium]
MNYKIDTRPIWDAYRSGCCCPLCQVQEEVERRQLGLYLNEAVMEPVYRTEVNKSGFCARHAGELAAMKTADKNSCGLALQLSTRSAYVRGALKATHSAKAAKREAERAAALASSCVICAHTDDAMERYAETAARMYAREPDFSKLFAGAKAYCLSHYALLLAHSGKAGNKTRELCSDAYKIMDNALCHAVDNLDKYCALFDYRGASGGDAPAVRAAVPDALKLLK